MLLDKKINSNGIVIQCPKCKRSTFYAENDIILETFIDNKTGDPKMRYAGVEHECLHCNEVSIIFRKNQTHYGRYCSYGEIFIGTKNPDLKVLTPSQCREADKILEEILDREKPQLFLENNYSNICFTFPSPCFPGCLGTPPLGFGIEFICSRDGEADELPLIEMGKDAETLTPIISEVFERIGLEREVKPYIITNYH